MGEVLRAVLESECVTSRPKFYAARMTVLQPAAPPSHTQSTVTTFDKTAWFLLTSFYVGSTAIGVSGTNGWGLLHMGQDMQLENVQTRRRFYQSPPASGGPLGILVGSYQGSPVELADYVLFAPGERVKWSITQYRIPFDPGTTYYDICYAGIEYIMPKEAAAYGAP